jgi:mannose/cellobiose epimerase-like protein (N-acyl-D-glucosamine 2-epimerase family)
MTKITDSKYGKDFLLAHAKSILDFGKNSISPHGGFGYLDAVGAIDTTKPRETYQQARFTQVYGIAHLMGLGDYSRQISEGINSLNSIMRDQKSGGYFNAVNTDGSAASSEKLCYDHVFVLLAAVMGKACGIAAAEETFQHIDKILDDFFWDEEFAMMNNHWDNAFSKLDSYRGMNSNMHAVEGLLAAFDVTGDQKYFDRAYSISKRSIDGFARQNPKAAWMLPEHFDSAWVPDLDFNSDNPADPFRPYGVTIGHLFEWARLLIHLHQGLTGPEHEWMLIGSRGLYETAKKFGWAPDGGEGFVYTLDWDATVITAARMWWVPAEAVLAAYCLFEETGEDVFADDYQTWWSYIDRHVIDHVNGSWLAELDKDQNLVSNTWEGKPDIYHNFQAAVLPLLPSARSFVGAALKR